MSPELPEPLHELAKEVAHHKGRAFLVGGGVRDHLLGHAIKDWDVEVFGVPMSDLVRLLRSMGSVNAVGRSFGVLKWRPRSVDCGEVDVSIPRRDSKIGRGHRGISVEGDPDMTIEEAVQRRDLTINAMMWDITSGILVDPSEGRADLEARRLRAVDDDTFLEDPLRALRVVQFAARLAFSPEPALLALCRAAALDELPAERIQLEWGKLLVKGGAPSRGFQVAREANVVERVFPEVGHLNADRVLDTLVLARHDLDSEGLQWCLMLSGWLHEASASQVEATLDRLWLHTVGGVNVRALTTAVVANWRMPISTDPDLRYASVNARLRLSLPVRAAAHQEDVTNAWSRAAQLGILDDKPAPLVQGRDLKELGMPPGPSMGDVLRALYDLQLQGSLTTRLEGLAAAQKLLDDDT